MLVVVVVLVAVAVMRAFGVVVFGVLGVVFLVSSCRLRVFLRVLCVRTSYPDLLQSLPLLLYLFKLYSKNRPRK